LLAGAWAVAGVLAVWLVVPGLPYDEPSHWSTVLYYAAHHRLPVLGMPGVTYEAQQTPLAYAFDALVQSPIESITGSLRASFDAVRVVGGIELGVSALFLSRILKRLVPNAAARAAAVAYLLLCPMFVAMAWSVQNDALSLLIAFAAMDFALTRFASVCRPLDGALAGALLALGALAKLTVWPLCVSLLAWLLWRYRRKALPAVVLFAAAFAVVAGWWFAWNHHVYGRFAPSANLPGGYSFGPYGFHGVGTIGHMVENVITYLWLPTEYYRNLIAAPAPLKACLALVTAAVVVCAVIDRPRRDSPNRDAWLLLALTVLIATLAWIYLFINVSALAPRTAYVALPWWILAVAQTFARSVARLTQRSQRLLAITAAVALLGLDGWVFADAHGIAHPPQIGFGATARAQHTAASASGDRERTFN